jgi:hypothetical protein
MNSRHIFLLDDISPYFNGAQTVFQMTAEGGHAIYASTAMNVLIDINGTRQEPQVAYTVYKNEITFTSPPLEGSSFHGIVMDVWAGAFSGHMPSDTAYAREAGTAGSTNSLGGKTENQLNVNSAQFVTGTVLEANNANYLGGKAESELSVATANNVDNFGGQAPSYYTNANNLTGVLPVPVLAGTYSNATVNNATYAYGKTEGQLNVNSAAYVVTALSANDSLYLGGFAANNYARYTGTPSNAQVLTWNAAGNVWYGATGGGTNATFLSGNLVTTNSGGLWVGGTNIYINSSAFYVLGSIVNATTLSVGSSTLNSTALAISSGNTLNGSMWTGRSNTATFLAGNTVTTNSTGIWVGANVFMNASVLSVGSNTMNSTFYTGRANTAQWLQGNQVTTNSTGIWIGANVYVNSSHVYVGGNTINSTVWTGSVNSATFISGNTVTTNSTGLFTGANVSLNTTAHFVGNSTINAYLTSTTLTINQATVNSSFYTGKANTANVANDSTYAYGKTEGNLNVKSAVNANTANNSSYLNTHTEAQLNVNSATNANNATYAFGKSESGLNVNSALNATNASYLGGKIASQYLYKYAGGSPSNGQVLTYSSANSSWYAANSTGGAGVGTHTLLQSNVHTDTTNGTVTRGDLITGQGATAKWTRLALRTSGYVLTSNGTEAVWQTFAPTSSGTSTQKLDDISGAFNGAQTVFYTRVATANITPLNVENLLISLAGIIQEPNVSFTLSGSTLTFAVAPPAGADFFGVALGQALNANNANNADYLNGHSESQLNVNSAFYVGCTTPTFSRVGMGTNVHANAVAVMAGQYFSPLVDDGNSGGFPTIDWNAGNEHKITLTDNASIDFSNPLSGGRYVLLVFQDGTGGRTVTWPASVAWPSATPPTLTTGAGKMDIVTFFYDSTTTTYYGAYALNY